MLASLLTEQDKTQQDQANLLAANMCVGSIRKKPAKKVVDTTHAETTRDTQDYSHIFSELETQLIVHRALMMQRLVQDPFYRIMNVSSAARLWMLRRLAYLADHAEHRYNVNLMQFFELIGRDEMLKFLRYKNAPNEMIVLWDRMHPPNPEDNNRRTARPNIPI